MITVLVLLGTFTPLFSAEARVTTSSRKEELRGNIEEHKIRIRSLQRGIREQQELSKEKEKQEQAVLKELKEIDDKLQNQLKKVEELESKALDQQILINIKQMEVNSQIEDRNDLLAHLQKRTKAYYKMGKVGLLNVAFSTKSLPELLKFQDSFEILISYDKDIFLEYRAKIDELERVKEAFKLEKNILDDFIAAAKMERKEFELLRQNKELFLTEIRSEKDSHDKAIVELEEISDKLFANLSTLENKENRLSKTFLLKRGKHPAPLSGKLITRFNEEKKNKLGIVRKSSGIALKAADGTRVKAIANGTVIFSGYLRGYGNTVVIHHGFKYYSVTSRMERIPVKKGQTVKTGSTLGYVSDTATLIDDGLYLEIRKGKKSLDPLAWISSKKIRL